MEIEMQGAVSLTLNEAGYVVGQSSRAINRAVDRGVIRAKTQRRGKARLRKVGAAELRFLAITSLVEKDLTPSARRKVYEAVRRLPAEAPRLVLGVMELKLTDIDQRISERLQRLERVKALVDDGQGTDPMLRGTAVPVYAVAALARGQSVKEIIEDYPGLTSAQVEAAVEYAKVYPKPGRPLPPRSLKRMLGDMAASGVWDLENEPQPVSPQPIP
jgi:uncharacterized protein (DUF433 family)